MARTHRLRNIRRLVRWVRSLWTDIDGEQDGDQDYSEWPTTQAEVFSCVVREQSDLLLNERGHRETRVGADISYSYKVNGESWSGSTWITFADESSARYYAHARPGGSSILIRYCPDKPDDSVMLERDQPDADPVAVEMQRDL